MKWKTYGLVVSTSTACFLCYQEIGTVSSDAPFSLKNMCRHLRINLKETITVPEKLLPILEKMDVQVSLCGGCGSETEKFSEIYREMEGIRMRLTTSLETIHKRLEGAMNRSELVEQFQKKLERDPQALLHSVIVEKLRKEVAQKCHFNIGRTQPRVKIWRLPKNQLRSRPRQPNSATLVSGLQLKLDPEEGITIENEMIDGHFGHSSLPSMDNMNLRRPSPTLPFKANIVTDVKPLPLISKPNGEGEKESLGVSHPHLIAMLGASSSSQIRTTEGTASGSKPFSCQFCWKSFSTKIGLLTHVSKLHNIVTRIRKFKCDLCPKSFTSNSNLKYHLLGAHFRRRLPCQYCHKTFPHSTISQHQKFHCKGFQTHGKGTVTSKGADPDLAAVESGEACIDNRDNVDFTPTQQGISRIVETRPLTVNLAGPHASNSANPQNVQNSSNFNVNEPTGVFTCEMCIERFDNLADKRRHIREQHRVERLICQYCQKSFATQNCRDRHIRQGYCTASRPTQNQEGNHNHVSETTLTRIREVIGDRQAKQVVDPEMSYSCQVCGKSFASKIGLGTHVAKIHDNPSKLYRFKCDLCGKTFIKRSSLQQHRMNIHFGSQFRCQCGKSYGLESSLYAHQKSCCEVASSKMKSVSGREMKSVSDIIATHRQLVSLATCVEGNSVINLGNNSETITNDVPGTVCVDDGGVVNITTSGVDVDHDHGLSANCEQLMPGLNYYQFRTEEERLEHLQPDPLDDLS